MEYRIAYLSVAVEKFSSDDLLNLLKKARAFNQSQNITGILIYREGVFFQILEGPQKAVDDLMDKIDQDPRHEGTKIVYRHFDTDRIFQDDWYMAYRDFNEYDEDLQHRISDLIEEQQKGETIEDKEMLVKLARALYKGNLEDAA